MNFSEAAKLSALSRKAMEGKIEEYAKQFRPKVIKKYKENGHKITVYESADCSGGREYIKPIGRNGRYDL